jgi:hypothetical protein
MARADALCYSADGLFLMLTRKALSERDTENRPIVFDSDRNLAKFESREFSFGIISEKF